MELNAMMVSAKFHTVSLYFILVLSVYQKVNGFKNAAPVRPVCVDQSSLCLFLYRRVAAQNVSWFFFPAVLNAT